MLQDQTQKIDYLTHCPESLLSILKDTCPSITEESSLEEVRVALKKLTYVQFLSQQEALVGYAQRIFDTQKADEAPYALVVLVCLRHIFDNYDELADQLCLAIEEPWITTEGKYPEAVQYSVDLYQRDVWNPKHKDLNLAKWQQIYDERRSNLKSLKYKMQESIKGEAITDISTQVLDEISLPESFTLEALEILQHSAKDLNALYKSIKDRKFEFLMEDSCSLLNKVACEMTNLGYLFECESKLAGDTTKYFEELNDNTSRL